MVDKFAIVSLFGVFQGKLVLCVVQKTLYEEKAGPLRPARLGLLRTPPLLIN